MQTLNFTPKLLRQRRFLSFLLPFLAFFVGLGMPNLAYAQPTGASTATIRDVYVTAGTSAAAATTDTYNAIPTTGGSGIGGGIFANTNFGSLDVNAGRLLLQGGKVEITENAGEVYTRAYITYGVVAGNLASGPNPTINQTLELVETGFSAGVRTFELTAAARDILALATTAGSPGTSYRFDIAVNALGEDTNGDPVTTAGTASRRRSVFTATGSPSSATITANNVFIAPNAASNVTYNINPANSPLFQGADLNASTTGGAANVYDVNTGQLLLNGGTVTTTESGANTVSNVVLYYRVRSSAGTGGAYESITLTQTSGANGGTKVFSLTTAQRNIIATGAVTAAGNYTLEVYFQANGTGNNGTPFSLTSPTTIVNPYAATFQVTGTPIAQTIWIGGKNDNWFDAANWSNGVPTATTNALVRDLGAGNTVPYPNIYAGIAVYATNANGTQGALLYDNTAFPMAETRDLTMGGTSQASRSITRLNAGRLKVYGDFNNNYASFIQRENTVIEFGGNDQAITGGTFVAVEISGGGTKTDLGLMEVSQSITFTAGILATDISRPLVSLVVLADRAPTNGNNGAQLINETDAHYLRGFAKTIRQSVLVGETRTYGNMGMTLTFTGTNSPGNVEVTRNTSESYTPLNNKYGIRRIFGVRPSDAQTSSGGLTATMVFRYLDSETMNLNGPNTTTPGTDMIPEPNLTIFVSTNSGNTFQLVGRDGPVNTTTNEVTRTGVRTFATFTLGDQFNPLPVRLTAFDAKRVGNDALITWQTASEQNSKGYEVQVSTNGSEFRTLTMVPSASPNSSSVTNYRYVDTEANKTGNRYYRLHQLDLDGKDAFFKPVLVSFEGAAPASTLVAYPNPFKGGDELHLALQSAASGKGQVRILDMTGRTLRQQSVELSSGVSDIALRNFDELQAGVYMVRISLPSGETKTLKVVKQ